MGSEMCIRDRYNMSIEVIEIEEQGDGSARVIVDIDPETLTLLLEKVLVTALRDYIKEEADE